MKIEVLLCVGAADQADDGRSHTGELSKVGNETLDPIKLLALDDFFYFGRIPDLGCTSAFVF